MPHTGSLPVTDFGLVSVGFGLVPVMLFSVWFIFSPDLVHLSLVPVTVVYQQDVTLVLVVVMCVFIVCQTPTFIDHILLASLSHKAGFLSFYISLLSLFCMFKSHVKLQQVSCD